MVRRRVGTHGSARGWEEPLGALPGLQASAEGGRKFLRS